MKANIPDDSYFGPCHQQIHQSERTFLKLLVQEFISRGIHTEIRHNAFLVCPVLERQKIIPTIRVNGQRFKSIRPDIFLPHFSLAIEIDGPVHDRISTKIENDENRDILLSNLGVFSWVIKTKTVKGFVFQGEQRLSQVVKEIVDECQKRLNDPSFKSKRSKSKKNLSKYQALLPQDRNYQIYQARTPIFNSDPLIPGQSQIKYGGFIYKV
jgi:very-short-patch-repair endonuclease